MSNEERFLLQNIEALTSGEGSGGREIFDCYMPSSVGTLGYWQACESNSTEDRRCGSVHYQGKADVEHTTSKCYK